MKAAAGIVTLLAHTVAFVGLGSLDIDVDPRPGPPLDVTTIELVELPDALDPVKEEPLPAPEAAPELEPEPVAELEPEAPTPPPRPRPKPNPAAPNPTPEPAAPSALPAPATTTAPGPPASTGPAAPAAPRKLGQRFSNAPPAKGRQRSTAKRCTEPVVKPVPTEKVKPKFPAAALRSDIAGDLVLRASVDRSGGVTSVKVVTSPGASVEAPAKTAFAQWRFTPATACGKTVPSTYAKKWKFSGG